MSSFAMYLIPLAAVVIIVLIMATVKILRQYERAGSLPWDDFEVLKAPAWCSCSPSFRKWYAWICVFRL